MNSLAFIFSERHFNLKMIILMSFSFCGVWTSHLNFTIVSSYSNAHILTTIRDSCMKFSAFVQCSLICMMYVKTENNILCH